MGNVALAAPDFNSRTTEPTKAEVRAEIRRLQARQRAALAAIRAMIGTPNEGGAR